jgi:hypothetical protein
MKDLMKKKNIKYSHTEFQKKFYNKYQRFQSLLFARLNFIKQLAI